MNAIPNVRLYAGSLLILFVVPFLFPQSTWAQQRGVPSNIVTPNVKEYGREGYPEITVYVWGNADTGVWNVEKGTDLLEFLSVVSRVKLGERAPDHRSIETLEVYRDGRTQGEPFFQARVEELFTKRDAYPELTDGDILVLERTTRRRFTWRDFGQIVSTVGVMLNTYLILDRIRSDNN